MVRTRFKQVLFGANWDIQLHFSFLLTVMPQKIKNPKNKKQKKIDFVINYRKWKWKKKLEISICTKKYLFEPSLNHVLLFHFNSSKIEFSPRLDFSVSLWFPSCYEPIFVYFVYFKASAKQNDDKNTQHKQENIHKVDVMWKP